MTTFISVIFILCFVLCQLKVVSGNLVINTDIRNSDLQIQSNPKFAKDSNQQEDIDVHDLVCNTNHDCLSHVANTFCNPISHRCHCEPFFVQVQQSCLKVCKTNEECILFDPNRYCSFEHEIKIRSEDKSNFTEVSNKTEMSANKTWTENVAHHIWSLFGQSTTTDSPSTTSKPRYGQCVCEKDIEYVQDPKEAMCTKPKNKFSLLHNGYLIALCIGAGLSPIIVVFAANLCKRWCGDRRVERPQPVSKKI